MKDDFDIIDLDKTANISKLEIAAKLEEAENSRYLKDEYYEDENYEDYDEAVEYEDTVEYEDSVEYEDAVEYEDSVEYEDAVEYEDSVEYEDTAEYEETAEYEDAVEYVDDAQYEDEDLEFIETDEVYADDYAEDYEYEDSIDDMDDDDDDDDDELTFFEKIQEKLSHLNKTDWMVIGGAAAVFVILIVALSLYSGLRKNKEIVSLYEVGMDYASLGNMGGTGLNTVAQYALNYGNPEAEEEVLDLSNIRVTFISMNEDIKIKFLTVDDKLITGIPFEVTLTYLEEESKNLEKGTEIVLKDEDMDGIIHETDMEPGEYSVTLKEVEGSEFIDVDEKVKVKGEIEYQVIDVTNEIKKENEVNAAIEDTAINAVVEEAPTTTDTVEWVESSRTSADGGDGYNKINKDEIIAPGTSGCIERLYDVTIDTLCSGYRAIANRVTLVREPGDPSGDGDGDGGDGDNGGDSGEGDPPASTPTVEEFSINKGSLTLKVGDTSSLSVSYRMSDGSSPSISWSSSNSSVVSVDSNGNIKAESTGSATITASIDDSHKVSCSVTVEEKPQEVQVERLEISSSSVSIKVNDSTSLSVTIKMSDGSTGSGSISWSTSDSSVATVDNGQVKGVGVGTATITASFDGKSATCSVTVTDSNADYRNDTTTPLTTRSGQRVYVRNSDGTYRPATYADYYTDAEFFIESNSYRYTGWQTIDGNTYYFDKNGNKVTGDQIIQGVSYSFTSDGILATNTSGSKGIDVSKWNGAIDWNAVRNSGVSFVIIRCGYRGSTSGALIEDPTFRTNIQGARAAGLKVGLYFFTQAINEAEAVEEASMCVSLARAYGINYPIFIDTEGSGGRADGLSRDARTAVCRAFCQTVQNSGFTAGVYASKAWYNSNVNYGQLSGYKIWLAQYASQPTFNNRYDLWQYTSKGSVPGIRGNVDMNISYMGY